MNNTQMNSSNIYKDISDSPEIFASCQKIGEMFSLHIDQIGELDAQVREVLKGQAKSSSFTNDIVKYLEIDQSLADKIATEVNKEIFDAIKSQMQSETPQKDEMTEIHVNKDNDISNLERIGGFEILKESDNGNSSNNEPTNVESIETDNLLSSPIVTVEENAVPEAPSNLPTENSPSKPPIKPQTPPPITPTPTIATSPTPPSKKAYANDPYHEPI